AYFHRFIKGKWNSANLESPKYQTKMIRTNEV
ncbi:hypothetical protein A5876_001060, partial [Enterococcus sp. 3C8_DIV0646]